jgi:hypothetical protein
MTVVGRERKETIQVDIVSLRCSQKSHHGSFSFLGMRLVLSEACRRDGETRASDVKKNHHHFPTFRSTFEPGFTGGNVWGIDFDLDYETKQ